MVVPASCSRPMHLGDEDAAVAVMSRVMHLGGIKDVVIGGHGWLEPGGSGWLGPAPRDAAMCIAR